MPRGLRTFLLAGTLAALAAAAASARPLDEAKAAGDLRVALYSDNAPFSAERSGRPHGIDVDIAKALAEKLGLRLDLRLVDAGENVDGDLRLSLWKGDLAGSPLADLMLHVPNDRMLANRNEQVFLTSPYFEQRLALAYRKDKIERLDALADIEGHEVAAEGASASDIQLLTAQGGRYRGAVRHFRNFDEAAKAFLDGAVPILAGTHANLDAALHAAGPRAEGIAIADVSAPGPVKTHWPLGGAVRSNSRDLGYAIGDALTEMGRDGTLKAICARYGVSFTPPEGY